MLLTQSLIFLMATGTQDYLLITTRTVQVFNNLPAFFKVYRFVHFDSNFKLNFITSPTFGCHNIIKYR